MSVNAAFRRLSPQELRRIVEEDDASSFAVLGGDFVTGMAKRLTELGAPAEIIEQARRKEEEAARVLPPPLNLGKAWHCLHWLLTGTAEGGEPPLSWVVHGDREVGDDVGYGPACVLEPGQVSTIASALAGVTRDDLSRRFDVATLEREQIYPGDWTRDDDTGHDDFDWIWAAFSSLRALYSEAATRGDGVLVWYW
jgi:hypothetical protein